MRRETDPAINDRIEIMIDDCKELRALEEEMRDGISNYVEHFKKIKPIWEELSHLGLPDNELERIKRGDYDD